MPGKCRRRRRKLVLIAVALTWPLAALAAPPEDAVEMSGRTYITSKAQQSIDRALEWLASRQNDDGAFGVGGPYQKNVAVVSLGGLAFLSQGSTPGRGRYGGNIDRCVDYVLAAARTDGFISVRNSVSHGPMYGHGFATLFLAEVYGMNRRKDLRPKLKQAVKLIVGTQNDEGGWRYYPESKDADVSVTVCQIMALRAARNAGIFVPTATVEKCIRYVKRCQNGDGGFRYQLVRRRESQFPRSAAGLVALYSAGVYKGREVDDALRYLIRHVPRSNRAGTESHYFYGQYYAAQAMWHAGGNYWKQWYPAIRDELLQRQSPEGSWAHHSVGPDYATAMACIVLQVPNNSIPIFQR